MTEIYQPSDPRLGNSIKALIETGDSTSFNQVKNWVRTAHMGVKNAPLVVGSAEKMRQALVTEHQVKEELELVAENIYRPALAEKTYESIVGKLEHLVRLNTRLLMVVETFLEESTSKESVPFWHAIFETLHNLELDYSADLRFMLFQIDLHEVNLRVSWSSEAQVARGKAVLGEVDKLQKVIEEINENHGLTDGSLFAIKDNRELLSENRGTYFTGILANMD